MHISTDRIPLLLLLLLLLLHIVIDSFRFPSSIPVRQRFPLFHFHCVYKCLYILTTVTCYYYRQWPFAVIAYYCVVVKPIARALPTPFPASVPPAPLCIGRQPSRFSDISAASADCNVKPVMTSADIVHATLSRVSDRRGPS